MSSPESSDVERALDALIEAAIAEASAAQPEPRTAPLDAAIHDPASDPSTADEIGFALFGALPTHESWSADAENPPGMEDVRQECLEALLDLFDLRPAPGSGFAQVSADRVAYRLDAETTAVFRGAFDCADDPNAPPASGKVQAFSLLRNDEVVRTLSSLDVAFEDLRTALAMAEEWALTHPYMGPEALTRADDAERRNAVAAAA